MADDPKPCKIWVGQKRRPVSRYGRTGPKGNTYAHRQVFLETHGYLPEVVRHTCDNPPCVEPTHLVDGTQLDNVHDMFSRGRARPRGKVPMTLAEVEAIAARLDAGELPFRVAHSTGYSNKHIWRIKQGWRPKGGDSHSTV